MKTHARAGDGWRSSGPQHAGSNCLDGVPCVPHILSFRSFFSSQSRFLRPDYIYGSVTALPGSFYSNWMSRQNVQKYLKERAADKHSSPVMETYSAAALKKNVSEEGNLHSFPTWFGVTWHRRLWRRSRKNTGVIHNNDSLARCDVKRTCKRSSFPLKEILPNCPQMTIGCKKEREKSPLGRLSSWNNMMGS